ncbi:hypothetical protein ACR8AL_07445 [Clavibacter sepedonicus]|uniref:Uncharacterized protein n=1 Tax=Clavibacter sepedonicus TaxID=31964 RepID=B0RJF0_CLASE|nr:MULTISPECIES: hypothetical protein [Clavibacter]MBD5382471.1 hypothetical protein [Clavibacter sp.]OQJ45282.1 hypothetical protein B5P19_15590 [Clavibacter sepedonicus]OQJ50969.1 hypothetical protein B5P20_16225 [Clavibacter sepedonicus]UUK67223.1 hypothetical protein LRE50_15810 [Clavibacter sepedonicus]CAQ03340.1 hypothetical protein pCSL0097 [Clavibacter sepedonicus]
MTNARGADWTKLASHKTSVSREQIEEEDRQITAISGAPEALEQPRVVAPERKAVTYRFRFDVLALIELEVQAAKERGERTFKDTIVIQAIRATYGRKHSAEAVSAMADKLAAEFAAEEEKKASKRRPAS